jgi:pentatricopeptide repeat protein
VYREMRASSIIGSPECYTAAVHACSQKGDLECALSILEDLKKDGVKPDEVSIKA